MSVTIGVPRTDPEGLSELKPLWSELQVHHLAVSTYQGLVRDPELSWQRRSAWYRRLLASGAAYISATDAAGGLVGYAMVVFEEGLDDTFDVSGGVAEVVTLIVTGSERSGGIGRALLRASEDAARARGFDTVKIGFMSGNDGAQRFYEAHGYQVAEQILYRRLRG